MNAQTPLRTQLGMLFYRLYLRAKIDALSLVPSSKECPRNNRRNIRKSALFSIVGAVMILFGIGLFFDKGLTWHDVSSFILIVIGIVVLLAGIFGVCFAYFWLRRQRD